MRNFYVKMILFVLGVCFCIFFGVDLASRGMQRIEAPAAAATAPATTGTQANASSTAASTAAAAAASAATVPATPPATAAKSAAAAQIAKQPSPEPVRSSTDSDLNYVGNKIGGLLQIAAHYAIQLVVSFFEAFVR